jgi:hypothetical protein
MLSIVRYSQPSRARVIVGLAFIPWRTALDVPCFLRDVTV